jgi:hypothetical protein
MLQPALELNRKTIWFSENGGWARTFSPQASVESTMAKEPSLAV